MCTVDTEVLIRKAASFDGVGTFLGYTLKTTAEKIAPGIARLLVEYAIKRMTASGFPIFSNVRVYTLDGDEQKASDRHYVVDFKNDKGGVLTVQGIYVRSNGCPFLDHGFAIEG